MKIKVIKNRDGDMIPFDKTRIELAIEKASEQAGYSDLSFIDSLSDKII